MAEPVSIRLRLGFEDVDAFVRGYWRAAEAGTLFLATTRPQEAGALVRFELVSRKGERLFLAEGRVISVTPEGGASAPGMRLKLTRLNAEGKEIYERMLAQRPANQRSATAGGGPGMRAGTLPPGTARATTAGRTDAIEAIAEDLDSLLGGARTSTPSPAPAAPDPHEGRSISLEEATRLLDSISSPTPAHPEKAPPPTSSPPAPSPPASPPPVAARPTPPELRPSPPGRPSPPPATAVAPPPPPPPPAEPPAPPPWAKLR
ncbi:MAG: hypothetical protein RBU45_21975, partial [Myxococcota bacterium]|nr:hypothetical protein [Myxococcota bacterium]